MKKCLFAISITILIISCNQTKQSGSTTKESTYKLGQEYGGGIIFYLDSSGEHGLISAKEDLPPAIWGCNQSINIATGRDIGTGKANTKAIITSCNDTLETAAALCDKLVIDGYDDWYLPSSTELVYLYEAEQMTLVKGFVKKCYWSSTENSKNHATMLVFKTGQPILDMFAKYKPLCVRAIRSF